MSDTELDRQDDDPVFEEDNAHQTCYIFEPFSTNDLEAETPSKKRRKIKHSPDESLSPFPLLNHGVEPGQFAQIRHDTFQEVWSVQKGRIDRSMEKADEVASAKLQDFLRQNQGRNGEALRTALIVSGPDSSAQIRLLDRWQEEEAENDACVVVSLRASHCVNLQTTLKNVIKSTITTTVGQDEYQSFLNKHKRLTPMNFDLELLQTFVNKHDLQQIVISIPDIETFDIGILSELFFTLSSWTDTIPFILLLGIATTVELFESRLPKSTVNLLDATTFTLQPSEDVLQQILDQIKQDEDKGISFGPLTISTLEELIQNQGTTIETFSNAVKYAIMSHFFANSLSVLLGDPKSLHADKSLCKSIRNTPSFQQYCEASLTSGKASARKEITQLLTDDEALLKASLTACKTRSSSPTAFTLPESHVINTRTLLHPFTPRPRHALERALSKPYDYLTCECCQPDATANSQRPPASTLYALLQEAGTTINVRDLHDAFCARQFPVFDDGDTAAEKADRDRMATFYLALAELRMLGLVKGGSGAGVKKRTAGAGGADGNVFAKGRDRYGDVDFVAKTGWAGL